MNAGELPMQVEEKSEDRFYSGAIKRIKRTTLILGVLLAPVAWLLYGGKPAAGFLLGAALSYLNFHLLARAVDGLASRIVESQSGEKGGAIVARFLLRYLVIGTVVYVTFISSFSAFKGLLVGLCVPVAGMMAEAACELYVALRRGI